MIVIDTVRCAFCGGCVSVCPVEALSLAETRLEVSQACIDCGDCVTSCPVGALSLEWERIPRPWVSRSSYDLVVVGAGPGGSVAAEVAARAGLRVLLLEKRQEIGSPVRCAEGVGHEQLVDFIEPDQRWIAASINQAEVVTVADGVTHRLHAAGGQGYILERRVFDRCLAERAVRAGAELRVKTAVTGLLWNDGCVCGLKVSRADFLFGAGEAEISAKVIIAADGVEAQTGRWAGLPLQLPLADTMVCVQYLCAGVDIDPTCNLYFISQEIAPGGYAWVFPKGEGKANVGLGVQANLWQRLLPDSPPTGGNRVGAGNVLDYLTRFIESQKCLEQGYPVSLIAGNVPVALPPERMATNGLMVIGDAARQVDPLTGGGIINAMSAGRMAAAVAVDAIAAGDTSREYLSRYEGLWQQSIGRKNQRNYRLRLRFPPEQRTDERFVHAFALAASG